jgi:hypothetical protein
MNYKHSDLQYAQSGAKMELDVFVPAVSLAIEYQGKHHYSWHFLFGNPESQIERDLEKEAACSNAGITLVSIPHWWDKQMDSLLTSIRALRPGM